MKYLEIESPNSKGILKTGKPYTLCIGAGVCHKIMPDWKQLTFEILRGTIDSRLTTNEFDTLVQNLGWSLDSILQAALNFVLEKGGSIDDFNDLIQKALYSRIIDNASKYGLSSKLMNFISDPFHRKSSDIIDIYNFFVDEYSETSLFQIAKFLIESKKMGSAPEAVLTFNADVLLHSLLTLLQLKETYDATGKTNSANFYYKAVHHVIESDGHKIPIYHIHGSIVPFIGKRDARQNLVFQEGSYHEVSGSTHSWQQTIFQHYALRSKMLFIGLSMSDSNIRRWLNHTNSVLNNDVLNIHGKKANVYSHIWFSPKSVSETEENIKKHYCPTKI